MSNDTDRKKIQELASSGEATRMIDALVKANPAKAAEAAEVRFEMQRARLAALKAESPDRVRIVGMEHIEEIRAAKKVSDAAFVDLTIKLVEEDKINNPDRTDFAKYEEEELKKRFDSRFENSLRDVNEVRADTRHSIQSQQDNETNMLLVCIAVGVAATALGAGSLAVASIGTACVISGYMKDLEPIRKNTLNGAQELTKDDYKVMLDATAKEKGKEVPSVVR